MSTPKGTGSTQPVDSLAIAIAILAVAAALATPSAPLAAAILAAGAIVLGVRSRRKLRADAELRGAALSALGFLVGVVVLALVVVRLALPALLVLIGP